MLKTQTVFICDVCGVQQQGDIGGMKTFRVTSAAQGKFPSIEHACQACRHGIYLAIGRTIRDLKYESKA